MIHGQQILGGFCFKVECIIYQHYLPPIKSMISPCAYLQLKNQPQNAFSGDPLP